MGLAVDQPMPSLLTAHAIAQLPEGKRVHQFNSNAIRLTRTLSDATGMQRIGVHLVRLVPGSESTQFHNHDVDEEFLYVLSGRGIAEIGEHTYEVGPGDFMGFPEQSPAHTLRNPFDEDLVYLMGGERNAHDIVNYPRIRRSMIKSAGKKTWVDWDHMNQL
jgi:uncharacterized cupin superfamily protein